MNRIGFKGGVVLIGESSWDLECFSDQGFIALKYFLHNDYFAESNKKNTKFLRRLHVFLKVLGYALFNFILGRRVYFSSMNSEVMVIAFLFSFVFGNRLFIPNVLGDPAVAVGGGGKISRLLFRAYKNRVIVTDEVTFESLSKYNPVLSPNYYKFELPSKECLKNLSYIVVLPAVLSHKATKKASNAYYEYCLELGRLLVVFGYEVYFLPHPREEGILTGELVNSNYGEIITSKEILEIQSPGLVYVSAYSSLSLNRRYGGRYGAWVAVEGFDILPKSLGFMKGKLTCSDYFKIK